LDTDFSLWKPGVSLIAICAEFVVEKIASGQLFLCAVIFPAMLRTNLPLPLKFVIGLTSHSNITVSVHSWCFLPITWLY